jgi:tetratricopeptide (TPR) repeat protein
VNRRELLRLLTVTGALVTLPDLDLDRTDAAVRAGRTDACAAEEYAQLNSHLWRVFALAPSKREVLPVVRRQLDVLSRALSQPSDLSVHRRLCALAADLFQLAGEIFFDRNSYTDAAHCYALAATAGREAHAFDLWACAMTRQAFVAVYEHQFSDAAPLIELAETLSRRGDTTLSTRQWVAAVQAEVAAGLGDLAACQRALDTAEQVRQMPGPVHNGGWLRFDGSRLAEERGTCYVSLGYVELADAALQEALVQPLSPRRRVSVLTDLARVGVQRGDPDQVVTYGDAAVSIARETDSGVVSRKLAALKPHLASLGRDRRVHRLNEDVTALVGSIR